MSIVYSEIIWLGAIVLVLTSAALIGLWTRQNPDAFEPVKPMVLSPTERELLLEEKASTFQKAIDARKAVKKAGRVSRRELLKSRRAIDAKGTNDVTS